jgi:hypothetical protein
MSRRVILTAGAAVVAAACSAPAVDADPSASTPTTKPTSWGTGPWRTACTYDTGLLPELSGLAPSQRHKGVLWAINDGGNDPVLYALDADDCSIRAQHTLSSPNTDWEALASGRNADGQAVLWVGDIGDNLGSRSDVRVLEVPEPALGITSGSARVHRFSYPGGPRDAEALMAEPDGSRLYVIAKTATGPLYRIRVSARKVEAARLTRTVAYPTDASLSRRGYAIRDYVGITSFHTPVPGTRIGRLSPPLQRQAEVVAFSRSARWLYTASEGDGRLLRAKVTTR